MFASWAAARRPRIASLLPSATEIVRALGLESSLVAVSHSCDFPGVVETLPRVTRTTVPSGVSSHAIDAAVRECLRRGESLYQLDDALLERLRPDLIVTQSLCEVCAVGPGEVDRALPTLGSRPAVLTLEPHTLEEVFGTILTVGEAVDRASRAAALVGTLRRRVDAVRTRAAARRSRPRVAFLEWADPPISGGHWNPELVELAGGKDGLGQPGARSRAVPWEEVLAWSPEVLVLACCGFDEARGREELELLRGRPGFADLPCARSGRMYVMDGVRLFSRPGPSLVESLERLATALATDPPQSTAFAASSRISST
jgi:iron complex transport system substrate-binding protein